MQSETARCANCGCREFSYHTPDRVRPGGFQSVIWPPFSFSLPHHYHGDLKPCLCCIACGYWQKTWPTAGEGSPELAGTDQAMGGAGDEPRHMVPAENQ